VNPLWTHLGAKVLDRLEGAIATVLVGYSMKKVSNALAVFKKTTWGASLKKLRELGHGPESHSPFEDVVQGSFARVTVAHPTQGHGYDVAFYTSSGPGVAQCKYYSELHSRSVLTAK
jgi:hypothetical protein